MPEPNPLDPITSASMNRPPPTPVPYRPPQPRTKPMAVLCLGLSRTGTLSLYLALNALGYSAYHAAEMARNEANEHVRLWREAVEVKYFSSGEKKKGYKKLESTEDFDELLWDYDALTDIPTVLFAPELLHSYPSAKVILTERKTPEEWVKSVESILYHILNLRIWRVLEVIDTGLARHYIPLLRHTLHIWTSGAPSSREALKQGYLSHNAHIRRIVPEDNLLIYRPGDGWEPLCKFLGKDVPEGVQFPRVNVGNKAAVAHEWVFPRERFRVVGRKLVRVLWPVVVVVGAVGWAMARWR